MSMDFLGRVVLYNKHLETLGGGEAHSLRLFKAIIEISKKEGVILSPARSINTEKIKSKFNIDLKEVEFYQVPNLLDLPDNLPESDIFIDGTDLSIIRGRGKKNILLVYFPIKPSFISPIMNFGSNILSNLYKKSQKRVFSLGSNFLGRYKSLEPLASYDLILANSEYTKYWIKEYWSKNAEILYPPINTKEFKNNVSKQNKIIAVGRFFSDSRFVKSHNKRQDILIEAFKRMIDKNTSNKALANAELHLVGSVGAQIRDKEYLESLKMICKGYKVYFHLSPTFDRLKKLYAQSKIFWHAAGFGIEENKHPEQLEHFGMTTVEAMSSGCIPVVINKGGQKEIVINNENGFLWNNTEELITSTEKILEGKVDTKVLQKNAIKSAQNYSLDNFNKRVKELVTKYKLLD